MRGFCNFFVVYCIYLNFVIKIICNNYFNFFNYYNYTIKLFYSKFEIIDTSAISFSFKYNKNQIIRYLNILKNTYTTN